MANLGQLCCCCFASTKLADALESEYSCGNSDSNVSVCRCVHTYIYTYIHRSECAHHMCLCCVCAHKALQCCSSCGNNAQCVHVCVCAWISLSARLVFFNIFYLSSFLVDICKHTTMVWFHD